MCAGYSINVYSQCSHVDFDLKPCSCRACHDCNLIWMTVEQLGQRCVRFLHSFSLLGKSLIPARQLGRMLYMAVTHGWTSSRSFVRTSTRCRLHRTVTECLLCSCACCRTLQYLLQAPGSRAVPGQLVWLAVHCLRVSALTA